MAGVAGLVNSGSSLHQSQCEAALGSMGSAIAAIIESLMVLDCRIKSPEEVRLRSAAEQGHRQVVALLLGRRCRRVQGQYRKLREGFSERQAVLEQLVRIELPRTQFSNETREDDRSRGLLARL